MAEEELAKLKSRLIGKLARVVTISGSLECPGIIVTDVTPYRGGAYLIHAQGGEQYHFGGDTNWLVEVYGEGVIRE